MPETSEPKYTFNVAWSEKDEAFIATCPEFPGLSAYGPTAEEAITEAKVALDLYIEEYEEEGFSLPEPRYFSNYSGQTRLRMPKWLHAQLARQADVEGVSLNTLIVSFLSAALGESKTISEQQRQLESVMSNITQALRGINRTAETMHASISGWDPEEDMPQDPELRRIQREQATTDYQ